MFLHKIVFITLLFSGFALFNCAAASPEIDLIINPNTNVGAIHKNTTEQDLIKLYGKDNVTRHDVDIGEGETVPGTILFPGTRRELTIEWQGPYSKPVRLSVVRTDSEWTLASGVRVGSTLDDIAKANNGMFKLTGFEWDYPGRTVSWEKGKLDQHLQLDLGSDVEVPMKEYTQVLGDTSYRSDNPVIRKMQLKVEAIYIRWDY